MIAVMTLTLVMYECSRYKREIPTDRERSKLLCPEKTFLYTRAHTHGGDGSTWVQAPLASCNPFVEIIIFPFWNFEEVQRLPF